MIDESDVEADQPVAWTLDRTAPAPALGAGSTSAASTRTDSRTAAGGALEVA